MWLPPKARCSKGKACPSFSWTPFYATVALPGSRSSAGGLPGRPLQQENAGCTGIEVFHSKMSILLSSSAKKQVRRQPGSELTSLVMWLSACWAQSTARPPMLQWASRQHRGQLFPWKTSLGDSCGEALGPGTLPGARLLKTLCSSRNRLPVRTPRDPPQLGTRPHPKWSWFIFFSKKPPA